MKAEVDEGWQVVQGQGHAQASEPKLEYMEKLLEAAAHTHSYQGHGHGHGHGHGQRGGRTRREGKDRDRALMGIRGAGDNQGGHMPYENRQREDKGGHMPYENKLREDNNDKGGEGRTRRPARIHKRDSNQAQEQTGAADIDIQQEADSAIAELGGSKKRQPRKQQRPPPVPNKALEQNAPSPAAAIVDTGDVAMHHTDRTRQPSKRTPRSRGPGMPATTARGEVVQTLPGAQEQKQEVSPFPSVVSGTMTGNTEATGSTWPQSKKPTRSRPPRTSKSSPLVENALLVGPEQHMKQHQQPEGQPRTLLVLRSQLKGNLNAKPLANHNPANFPEPRTQYAPLAEMSGRGGGRAEGGHQFDHVVVSSVADFGGGFAPASEAVAAATRREARRNYGERQSGKSQGPENTSAI